jgi:hypothetical protein
VAAVIVGQDAVQRNRPGMPPVAFSLCVHRHEVYARSAKPVAAGRSPNRFE